MINFHPLYSSSSGNMFHLQTDKANILIDAGVSYKAITEGLKNIDKDISDINAILITHEHIDHIKGLPLLCRKNNIPIYTCSKTALYLEDMLKERNISSNILSLEYGQTIKIKDLQITPFETSHDALMPCGFKIKTPTETLGYATDLGYVSDEILDYLKESDYIVLESNYDKIMLDYGKYPYPLKRRIKSSLRSFIK
ncbi:MAG: MBL fold metallo-hydrolase [Clostridia bacterium]